MSQSVLEQLLEMGFDKSRAELAVKKSDGCEYLRLITYYWSTWLTDDDLS